MHKLVRSLKFHLRAILLTGLGFICILAAIYVLMNRSPSTFWMPSSSAFSSDEDIVYELPVNVSHATTTYGRALVFSSSNHSTTVYEFRASPLLRASTCPNFTGRSSLNPSRCEIRGNFNGTKTYKIDRNDASSLNEQYIQLGNTFIYVVANFGDASYFQHFISIPSSKLADYLAANHRIADPIVARQQQAKAIANQKAAIAYTKLPFIPALPKALPAGWHMLTQITGQPIQIDGPDADHPMLVSTDYTTSNNGRGDVEFHVGLLAAFRLGDSCGPTPGYSMQNLPCAKVPDTDYYEAKLYDDRGDFVRYLYRPLGDILVITEVELVNYGGAKPNLSPDLKSAQNAITSAAQPVDMAALKGSAYSKVFY